MEKQTKFKVVVSQTMEEEMFFREEENDLACWELINDSSDSDGDDVMSFSDDASWLSSSPKDSPIPDPIQDSDDDGHHHHHDHFLDCGRFHEGYGEPYIGDQEGDDGNGYYYYEEEEEEEEEDDDDDGVYDLDDELVPWALSGKFGRQRMRKLGKRSFAKMHTSKRSPFLYLKPGCVHGKHGLGLKHSF